MIVSYRTGCSRRATFGTLSTQLHDRVCKLDVTSCARLVNRQVVAQADAQMTGPGGSEDKVRMAVRNGPRERA